MMTRWITLLLSLPKKGRDELSKRVSIDAFADELVNTLKEYTEEVTEGMEKAKEDEAKKGAKTLRATSPVGKRKRRRRYRQGWRAKQFGTAWAVYNATDYQLTHLLEKGHALVNGGRTSAIVHIAPVEDQVIIGYEKQLEKVIKG